MATAVQAPSAVPSHEPRSPPSPKPADQISILEEVRLIQARLRDRLAGAISKSPAGSSPSDLATVPLIDLAASFDSSLKDRQNVASEIRQACLTTGFFQIANHGISTSSMEGILTQSKRYFRDLTPAQKDSLHVKHSGLFRGYEPGDYTYTNPDDTSPETEDERILGSAPETKEGFNWGYEPNLDPTGGDGKYVELDGQPISPSHGNVWPSESDLPGFFEGVKDYYGQVLALARHLFQLFALSLDLGETYFDHLTTHPGGIGRLLYYPAQPAGAGKTEEELEKEAKLGLGAHTDYECFTLLLSSAHPGLEILFPPSPATDNKPIWRPCPIRPGTLTVNVADFLMRWTNGLYKSTIHRVVSRPVIDKNGVSKGCEERYSVPFFFSINYEEEVRPLPEKSVGKTMFQPMPAGRYVLERLRATKIEG